MPRSPPHPTSLILTAVTPDGQRQGPYEIPMEPKVLMEEAQKGGFWSYIAGVAYQALINYHVRGLVIDNYQDRPAHQKGVVLVGSDLRAGRTRLQSRVRSEADRARRDGNGLPGRDHHPSRCGRLDQGCAFGNRPVLMTFDGERLETEELRVNEPLYFVLVDLQARKDTMEILNRLNHCYPFAENEVERGVQELLGPINKRIVEQAMDALQKVDAQRLGALMTEAQAFFDRYAMPACPEELTSPVLHKILEYEALKPHVWGGKGVGSQGDGTAQFICRSESDQQAAVEILQRDLGMPSYKLTITPQQQVRKALIPAAGFGTRLFPASKATKKELFPIIDRDGIAKPAILLIVEEALEAGIEEVILVVQENDLDEFKSFFNEQVTIENYNKLPRHFQEYSRHILDIGRHVKFIVQTAQEGFGHAVYAAKEEIGNEPFLLMLGDHLYRSTVELSCARQLLDAYQRHGTSILGLRLTPEAQIGNFGTVTGVWVRNETTLNITEFAEKPNLDYARTNLRVPGLSQGDYLTVFGQYIIKPKLFDYLREHIENNVRENGEFQLTSALDRLRQEDGFLGLMIQGKRYDIGLPQYYLETLQTFSQS